MKLLYMCDVDLEDSSNGVAKKIEGQVKEFERNNINVTLLNQTKEECSFLDKLIKRLPKTRVNSIWDLSNTNLSEYDVVYIRKPFLDEYFLRLLSLFKISGIYIILEIPTYPYTAESNQILDIPLKIKEKNNTKKLVKFVDKIVTYSKDEVIFGIETLSISNGIEADKFSILKNSKHETINLIAVANFSHWHGYDRLIDGFKQYYSSPYNKRKVLLYLVGEGKVLEEYREKVEFNGLTDYVIFCGKKSGFELDKVYNIADIGIDSMGRHRSGVYYNSSLKGKEYLIKGLPIVSGVATELDNDLSIDFYKRVPSDESPINIQELVDFYDEVFSKNSRENIHQKINEYAKTLFDNKVCFYPVIIDVLSQQRRGAEEDV